MDFDWFEDVEMEEDTDMDDDEEEIRQLDAVLEEADIEVCDESADGTPDWQITSGSSLPVALPSKHSKHPVTSKLSELSKIDSILALNKLYDVKLQSLEKLLTFRLRECRIKLSEIQSSSVSTDRHDVFRYINCGRPYFRDNSNFPAPDNEDTILAKSQMYDFSLVTSVPGWTVRDKNQFTNVMIQSSLKIRKEALSAKIRGLKQSLQDNPSKMITNEIAKLKKEIGSLNSKMPLAQLALPLDEEYDWQMLANQLNKRHTPHEYRCLWKLYFHPSINKSSWKNNEHKQLQSVASTYNYQDWDEIARELNTGRTGYQCFVYYRTNITNNFVGRKWTHEEVTYLKRLIEYFREDCYIPWGKIAAAMEQRTKVQIYNKYVRLIEQRKGRFLPEEDAVILNCVEKYGPNFKKVSEYLAHRSMVQIRSRYHVLNKMRVSTVWSIEDDRKLLQIVNNADSNMSFSVATKFFPGRNRSNIRSRYVTLIKWMKCNPNSDIQHAPRRGARRLNHGQASDDLNLAIENLKNTLNTEVSVKKDRKKITRDSDEIEIEDAIIATLVNEAVREQEIKKSSLENCLVLPNETVVSNKKLDLTNLRKCLIYLGSKLSKNLYDESKYSVEYPDLGDSTQDICLLKVKSYSKRETVVTINVDATPDVWGNSTLVGREYVLPPHYATVTGCKALMSHVTSLSTYCNSLNIPVLSKRNLLLKQNFDLLLERFYLLFLWPMLLSNEGPTDFHNSKLHRLDSFYVRPPGLPNAPAITIKVKNYKKYNNRDVSEVIDLSENKGNHEEISITDTLMSEEDDVADGIKFRLNS